MTSHDFLLNFQNILPILVLIASAVAVLMAGLWISERRNWLFPFLAALGLLLSLILLPWRAQEATWAFDKMLLIDGFSTLLSALFLGSGLVMLGLSVAYFRCGGGCRAEYYALLLFSLTGMLLMTVAADLIVVFLALELLSLPLYVMTASACLRSESEEAAIKYFLMGAFAGGFVLYGIALIFGATGATNLNGIVTAYHSNAANLTLLATGAGLLLVGLGFKIAIVPFHTWTPDVYQGAPSPVTAFLSAGAKTAGFVAMMRIFQMALAPAVQDLVPLIWLSAALTMLLGNLAAIPQSNLKRMLAYSSIAHAGYMFMPLVTLRKTELTTDALASILFYLLVYALSSFGTWAVVIALEKGDGSGLEIDDLAGLGRKRPILAASMAIFMLSFIGMPPMLGFVGKLYLFQTIVAANQNLLALIGLIASLISAVYYLRVIVVIYMREGEPTVNEILFSKVISALAALTILLLPIFATYLFKVLWRVVFYQ